MKLRSLLSLVAVLTTPGLLAQDVTLERIMADPDWIARSPESPYFADDGSAVFFFRKRAGEETRELFRVPTEGGEPSLVPEERWGRVDAPGGLRHAGRGWDPVSGASFDWDSEGTRKIFERNGDLFLFDRGGDTTVQLTRTDARESDARFMIDESNIMYRRSRDWYVRDLRTGTESQVAELLTEDDPDEKEEEFEYLRDQQERLFKKIRETREERERRREVERRRRAADPTRLRPPFYLGNGVEIAESALSPSGQHLFVAVRKEQEDRGRRDSLPIWITEDGYAEVPTVRPKVGDTTPSPNTLLVLDLETGEESAIDLEGLPGIDDDPLRELREAAEARWEAWEADRNASVDTTDDVEADDAESEAVESSSEDEDDSEEEEKPDESKPRPVYVAESVWAPDGSALAVMLRSFDFKDRWIALVDPADGTLTTAHRLHDEAWVNWWRFNEFGWLPDSKFLYFLSEETGYSHLYLYDVASQTTAMLTSGDFEVYNVMPSRADPGVLYYSSNESHPGVDDLHRIETGSGEAERITSIVGRNAFSLSPDESLVLIENSTTLRPVELYVQDNQPGAAPRRLTRTVEPEFAAIEWKEPDIVAVPNRHGQQVWSRLYTPDADAFPGERPAVLFIHGAGYTQHAHKGWTYYFREHMFHTLLTRRGYVVLDMDYRASQGYGRDWRTAIYRKMGTPELEDLEDGAAWLVANHAVDPERIGAYGGSYGGFMTLMALFKSPDVFACGAALRPVTDWAHYNHGYTAAILNTPEIDPEAYERSSPIELAEGLEDPLLICHGMLDDNVLFHDTVRLAQRLIELEKEDWEVAIYPVEPHSFREPSSWLDEYRRILDLFETHLNNR